MTERLHIRGVRAARAGALLIPLFFPGHTAPRSLMTIALRIQVFHLFTLLLDSEYPAHPAVLEEIPELLLIFPGLCRYRNLPVVDTMHNQLC